MWRPLRGGYSAGFVAGSHEDKHVCLSELLLFSPDSPLHVICCLPISEETCGGD